MAKYIVTRLFGSIIVVFVVAAVVFGLTAVSSGDPALIFAGDAAAPEDVARIREQMGLDQPIYVQFFMWASQIAKGNLGTSLFTGTPVEGLIQQRLEPTLMLATFTIVLSTLLAMPLGIACALRPASWLDRTILGLCSVAFSMPVFITGYLLVYIFSLKLSLLPVQGYRSLSTGGLFSSLYSLLLPALALSFIYIALLARTVRASLLEVLSQDYVRTARAKGLTMRRLIFKHALRNITNSVLTVVGLAIASLLGGVVIAETVFGIPGLGRLTVDAVLNRDYPVIQALILLTASVKIVVNLIVDLSYPLVDPRIRL